MTSRQSLGPPLPAFVLLVSTLPLRNHPLPPETSRPLGRRPARSLQHGRRVFRHLRSRLHRQGQFLLSIRGAPFSKGSVLQFRLGGASQNPHPLEQSSRGYFGGGCNPGGFKRKGRGPEHLQGEGFEILAFPCNQFGGQEPGSNEEIVQFACTRFKAEYPIFDKVDVNGNNAAPLYKYLKSNKGGLFGDSIKWNFSKFLVDKEGRVVDRYAPTTSPLSIEKDIKKLLGSS
uniref:Glutathione peroxidase n=1 Tax=Oryza punctata TaxID=4537 RepID=A0A0E0KTQ9_ORYPU